MNLDFEQYFYCDKIESLFWKTINKWSNIRDLNVNDFYEWESCLVVLLYYPSSWIWASKRIFEASYKNNESLKKEDNSFSLVW